MQICINIFVIFLISLMNLTHADSWQPLPEADLSQFSVDDFSDEEIDIPYYLKHFHRLANSIIEEGPHRGFIDISVWRGEKDNKPYNTRVMENILSLAYFYTKDRPWNIYYHHPQLRHRLEASLNYWCGMQSDGGKFSEYGPQNWNLAATAFATKFMGETLRLLNEDGTLKADFIQRVAQHDRKAIEVVLNDLSFWSFGKRFSNQYSNVWAGALAYLHVYPDDQLRAKLTNRIHESMVAFQSPAGYFYERSGPDWQYNMGTHHSNLWMAWHYARGTDREAYFLQKERHWYEWLAYNAVPEPNSDYYILNRAIETRQGKIGFHRERIPQGGEGNLDGDEIESTPLAKKVDIARAYSTTRSTYQEDLKQARKTLREQWPKVPELPVGDFTAFSPYAFLHRDHLRWFPTAEQKSQAKKQIPFFTNQPYIHQRVDDRHPIAYTYIKTPHYYAAFNSGEMVSSQQRYGLGLVWNQSIGTVLQSQTKSQELAWGTRAENKENVYEAKSFQPIFKLDGEPFSPKSGCKNLHYAPLTISYSLTDIGEKSIQFSNDGIHVNIEHPGEFTEQIPLLVSDYETMHVSANRIIAIYGDKELQIDFEGLDQSPRWNSQKVIGQKFLCGIRVKAKNRLFYTISFQ